MLSKFTIILLNNFVIAATTFDFFDFIFYIYSEKLYHVIYVRDIFIFL